MVVVLYVFSTLGVLLIASTSPEFFDPVITALLLLLCAVVAVSVFLYPYIRYWERGVTIEKEMPLFITRMGVLSTTETSRKEMIEVLGRAEGYHEIAKEFEKIHRLVTRWNTSLEKACRVIAETTPSELFADFLMRMAHAVESGETTEEFFRTEQDIFMSQFGTKYRRAITTVELLKEVFVVLTALLLMVFVLVVLIPFLTFEDVSSVLLALCVVMIVVEGLVIYLIVRVLPETKIWHDLEVKTDIHYRLERRTKMAIALTGISAGTALFLLPVVSMGVDYAVKSILGIGPDGAAPQPTWYPVPLILITLAGLPFLFPGGYANRHEEDILKRDTYYPAFIRSLGAAVGARSRSMTQPLKHLIRMDFGPLTSNIKSLYRRLNLRINSREAWKYFEAETLSELISKFNHMYVEGTDLGGDTKEIGRIISKNFVNITGLRDLRSDSASSFTWMLYGLTIMMTFLLYFTLYLVQQFYHLMSSVEIPGESKDEFFRYVWNMPEGLVNFEFINMIIVVVITVHCVISALSLKWIKGGHPVGSAVHFIGMMGSSAVTAFAVMVAAQYLLV